MSAARYQGVCPPKGKTLYRAAIGSKGKQHSLGSYATPAEAAVVYDEARIYLVSQRKQEIWITADVTLRCNTCIVSDLAAGHHLLHLQLLLLHHLQGATTCMR